MGPCPKNANDKEPKSQIKSKDQDLIPKTKVPWIPSPADSAFLRIGRWGLGFYWDLGTWSSGFPLEFLWPAKISLTNFPRAIGLAAKSEIRSIADVRSRR